jgi:hypothetical protein
MTNDQQIQTESAATLGGHLRELRLERALADLEGLTLHPGYAADLEAEIAHTRAAYVGAAVTEIASLRAALDGPLVG